MATAPSSSPPSNGAATIPPPSPSVVQDGAPSASSAIDFLTICHRLKTTKRTGWVRRDVKDPESIADHMHRMGLMALVASDVPGVDTNKCVKMAIVHDIAEAIVGDICPTDGISKVEKSRREQEALDHMCKILGGGSGAKEIADLWMEYEANSSLEAKFVKDLDKVEMILQALEYEDVLKIVSWGFLQSKGRIWMNFSSQLLGSSKLKLAKPGHQRLCREEGRITKSPNHSVSALRRVYGYPLLYLIWWCGDFLLDFVLLVIVARMGSILGGIITALSCSGHQKGRNGSYALNGVH